MSQPITPKPLASKQLGASPKLSPAILRRLSRLEADTGFDVISDGPRSLERAEEPSTQARDAAE